MEIKGEALLHAQPETVWAALHDTALLARCVPGCEEIHWLDEKNLRASLVLRIGTVKRRYEGHIRIAETVEYESYTLLLGGNPESPSVESRVRLEPRPEGTGVHYDVEANLDKYFNLLGGRAAGAVSRGLAGRFFKRLDAALKEAKAAAKHD